LRICFPGNDIPDFRSKVMKNQLATGLSVIIL